MSSDEKQVEVEIKKKKKKPFTCKTIIEAIYDKESGTVFGRTPKDWAFLFIFLFCFYTILFGYFALLLFIFISGITTPNVPFRTGLNSIIGPSPGFNFRPMLDNKSNLLSVSSNSSSYSFNNYTYYSSLYLNSNIPPPTLPIGKYCSSYQDNINLNNTCIFTISQLGACSNVSNELINQRFCVFLRINNIYGWLPNVVNMSSSNMNSRDLLVNCTGVTLNDTSKLGRIVYYPNTIEDGLSYGVFNNYYFPFLNQSTYWSPIVAVNFLNLTKGTTVNVVCTLVNVLNVVQNSVTMGINISL